MFKNKTGTANNIGKDIYQYTSLLLCKCVPIFSNQTDGNFLFQKI